MKPKMTKVERDALHWVNKIRRAEGRKALARMPKGDPSEIYSCPIARALDRGKIGLSGWIEVAASAKKKIAACKKARLVQVGNVEEGDDIVCVCFKQPKAFDRFITWFDAQQDDAAQALAR